MKCNDCKFFTTEDYKGLTIILSCSKYEDMVCSDIEVSCEQFKQKEL